jgi:hypothetical protein
MQGQSMRTMLKEWRMGDEISNSGFRISSGDDFLCRCAGWNGGVVNGKSIAG